MCVFRISDEEKQIRIDDLNYYLHSLNLRFEVIIITPDIARRWLKRNKKNRDTQSRKNSYARQMAEGVWDSVVNLLFLVILAFY
jgi:hypothetical protein